jgi:hypothetical protein
MPYLGPSPFAWLQFDENGGLLKGAGSDPVAALAEILGSAGVTDLVVLSHGWQNDLPDALSLYTRLWENTCVALLAQRRDPACFAVAGVLWPAKKFDAQYDGAEAMVVRQDAGGVRSVDDGTIIVQSVDDARFAEGLANLETLLGADDAAPVIAAARAAADRPDDDTALNFFTIAKAKLGYGGDEDSELKQDSLLFDGLKDGGADRLLSRYQVPFKVDLPYAQGTTVSLGEEVSKIFQGPRSAVLWALNKLTYYTMKKRAGTVGESLASTVLDKLAPPAPLHLHLVGHSFGGRLVSAAVNALTSPPNVTLASVTLLEAAYSHNGLTQGVGPFAGAVAKPKGPFTITHTHNDLACTIAYPLASRVAGDTISGFGDAGDAFGAMGANGPQGFSTGVVTCDPTALLLTPGVINTVLADTFILKTSESDAHNNVTNETCGKLVANALCTAW